MGRQIDHAGSIADMAVTLIGDYAERIEALALARPVADQHGQRLARLAKTMRNSDQLLEARVSEMAQSRIA
jgi:hypothetical protein